MHRGVRFEPDDGFALVRFPEPYEVRVLDLAARLSDIEPASDRLGSWLVARLAALSDHDPHWSTPGVEVEEEGLVILDLLALEATGKVLAKLQLQAGPEGAGLLGVAARPEAGALAVDALLEILRAAPTALVDAEIWVERPGEPPRAFGRRDGALLAE